jgi:hypothetical protein
MAQVQLRAQVWREGDLPLVGGNPPAPLEPDDAARPSPRPLLWVGVLCCIVAGAWLCGLLWRWASPGTPLCAAAWVLLCLLAIARAWRGNR